MNGKVDRQAIKWVAMLHEDPYTCPMHPEVVSAKPGRCPKCGMALVKAGEQPAYHAPGTDQGLGSITLKSYLPLIAIITIIALSALAASYAGYRHNSVFSVPQLLLNFMTGFFLVFAGFKLMDLPGFAEGYSTYDLLAKRWFGYGYIYPFIELGFGLTMLAGFHSDWLLWSEFGVMAFSGLGVAVKLILKERFVCACLGTFLKVPLTYITLVEDFGMAILALAVLSLT